MLFGFFRLVVLIAGVFVLVLFVVLVVLIVCGVILRRFFVRGLGTFVVLVEQRRHAIAFFLRIESAFGKVGDANRSVVERPDHRRDVTFVVEPRTQPQ